ncbi:MAG: ABC transporter permease [Duodenibacillus sp.]
MSTEGLAVFARHVWALTLKESRQIVRDKSAVLIGVVMPIILIVLFGYGMSFDIRNVRLGVFDAVQFAQTRESVSALAANPHFDVERFTDRTTLEKALASFEVEAALVFEKDGASAGGVRAQLRVNGIDAPRATQIAQAVTGAVAVSRAAHSAAAAGVVVTPRIWFNESANSRWYLVPGLFVVVMTIIGCMLTGLVIAREWERGTMEAMIATPVSPWALLLSKCLPYFALGMLGWALCTSAAVWLYGVPVRGSLSVIFAASALYLVINLGIGLLISGLTRSQFLSSQIAVLVSFLPAVLLSGFIFDLRNAPAWADTLAHLLPPVYYLEILKVGFLSGGMAGQIVVKFAILGGFAVLFLVLARMQCAKRIRR